MCKLQTLTTRREERSVGWVVPQGFVLPLHQHWESLLRTALDGHCWAIHSQLWCLSSGVPAFHWQKSSHIFSSRMSLVQPEQERPHLWNVTFFLCVCCNVLTGASHCLSCKSTSQKLCACTCTTCDYLRPCQGERVLCHGPWWCRPPSPSQPQWPTANWKFTQHNKVYLTSIKIHMLNKPDLTNLWFTTHLWAELCAFIHLYIYISVVFIIIWH